jgi:hypothetical protein
MTGISPIREANKRAILRQLTTGAWTALDLDSPQLLASRELIQRGRIEKRWNSETRCFEYRRVSRSGESAPGG